MYKNGSGIDVLEMLIGLATEQKVLDRASSRAFRQAKQKRMDYEIETHELQSIFPQTIS